MVSRDYLPSPLLREYISSYRLRHFLFDKKVQPTVKPFPPRPEQCVIFYIRGFELSEIVKTGEKILRPKSVVSGQFTERVNRHIISSEFLMVSVDLKPGALYRLTGLSFVELTNRCIDAELIFSSGICNVNERLSGAECYEEMIRIIDDFFIELHKQVKKEMLAVDHVLEKLISAPAMVSLDNLAKQAYLSPRQLERKFDERVGVSPKTLMRIARFNQSYWLKLRQPKLDWLSIAVSCGYSDYQHLAKEYKDFTYTTPNNFFIEEHKAPGRILGLTK